MKTLLQMIHRPVTNAQCPVRVRRPHWSLFIGHYSLAIAVLILLSVVSCPWSAPAGYVFFPGTTNESSVVLTTTNNVLFANGYSLDIGVSNTWSLQHATNGLRPGDFRTLNSNGLANVTVWMSNSTPHIFRITP